MMKRKMIALPLALSSLLIIGACGDDDADVEDIEVNDPVLEDDGENDTGIENEANDEKEKIEEDEDPEMQDEGSINDSTDDAND
ncbi:hypothetical protein WAX74_18710 [Psychrobacillus sp. FJAT-51614]|uniref:DNA primase n=1 Tax=Psychrobacillus mangrovi TaxID=3117745 RepID=A0ABU8FBN5_9BACI